MSLTPFRRKTCKVPTVNLNRLSKMVDELTTTRKINNTGKTDIYEKDGKLFYELELPGTDREAVDIKIKGDRMVVSSEIEETSEREERNYIKRSRKRTGLKKSFPLPETVNKEEIEAEFNKGILKIEVPFEKRESEDETVTVHID